MKWTLQLVRRIGGASNTQACGLTIIGVGMLLSTTLGETLDQPALREAVQLGIIFVGVFAMALLFSPKSSTRHPSERSEDAE